MISYRPVPELVLGRKGFKSAIAAMAMAAVIGTTAFAPQAASAAPSASPVTVTPRDGPAGELTTEAFHVHGATLLVWPEVANLRASSRGRLRVRIRGRARCLPYRAAADRTLGAHRA